MMLLACDDHRVVEGNLADGGATDLERIGAAARPDLEHLPECPCSGERLHTAPDRTDGVEPAEVSRALFGPRRFELLRPLRTDSGLR